MNSDTLNCSIANYYKKNTILYRIFYSEEHLHLGIWENNTKTRKEALDNTIKETSELLEISKNDVVLDAGCGVGGASFYITEKTGAQVFGITLSEKQLKIAEKIRNKKNNKLTSFSIRDFTNTKYDDNLFTKIIGIESICYAEKKTDFAKEAYRLLREGGKVAVTDAFLNKEENFLTDEEKNNYATFKKGLAVPNLANKEQFINDLKNKGFKNVRFYDKTENVKKSVEFINKISKAMSGISMIMSYIGVTPREQYENWEAGKAMKKMGDSGMVCYGIIVAEK